MNYQDFMLHIRQKVNALPFEIQFPNEPDFEPPREGAWGQLVFEHGGSFARSIGGKKPCTRYVGFVTLRVRCRIGEFDTPVMQLASEFIELLAYHTHDTLELDSGQIVTVGDNEDWYQVNASVKYTFDEIGA